MCNQQSITLRFTEQARECTILHCMLYASKFREHVCSEGMGA